MIPQCFPSVFASGTNTTEMVALELASAGSLVAWEDYIPVKMVSAAASVANTYDNNGAIEISLLASAGTLVAGEDFINILQVPSATVAWSTDSNGYIPVRDGV